MIWIVVLLTLLAGLSSGTLRNQLLMWLVGGFSELHLPMAHQSSEVLADEMHAVMYFSLGLFVFAQRGFRPIVWLGLVTLAVGTEVAQLWVPGRTASWSDGIINLGSLAVGAGCVGLSRCFRGASISTSMRQLKPILRKLIKFLGVGLFCTAIQYGILIVLVEWREWPPTLASSVGFLLSALVNYGLNRSLTFQSRAAHRGALPKFALISGMGLLLNGLILQGLLATFAWSYLMAQVAATIFVLIWNFMGSLLWTFRPSETPA